MSPTSLCGAFRIGASTDDLESAEAKGVNMLELAFEVSVSLSESELGREFIQEIKGAIRDTAANAAVGLVNCVLVEVGRVAGAGQDLFEVMDGFSSELGQYNWGFFKANDWDYKEQVRQQFEDIFGLDLFIINHVEVEPAFRGYGLGLLAVSRSIDIFGENCGLVALKPFPLQFRNYLDPGWQAPDGIADPKVAFRKASRRLQKYWSRAGFRPVSGTDYCALTPSQTRPTLKGVATRLRRAWRSGLRAELPSDVVDRTRGSK